MGFEVTWYSFKTKKGLSEPLGAEAVFCTVVNSKKDNENDTAIQKSLQRPNMGVLMLLTGGACVIKGI